MKKEYKEHELSVEKSFQKVTNFLGCQKHWRARILFEQAGQDMRELFSYYNFDEWEVIFSKLMTEQLQLEQTVKISSDIAVPANVSGHDDKGLKLLVAALKKHFRIVKTYFPINYTFPKRDICADRANILLKKEGDGFLIEGITVG